MPDVVDGPPLPVSVVVPTLGRPELLRACLESLGNCRPRASEIVVVDASGSTETPALVSTLAEIGARTILDERRGAAKAANLGLREAAYDTVLFTHDDCVVSADWVAVGARLIARSPEAIFTGSVYPKGDPRAVPGLAVDREPRDFNRTPARVLVAHNMGCSRQALLTFGGFDERMRPVAEDDDLAFRWLRAGRTLRYAPELKVWHVAWRTEAQLREVYRVYARGDGMVYAKHLLRGDAVMARYIASDLWAALRAIS